jgi:peptidoglycan/LPS O-acetylase OafA/YrhL
VERFIFLDAIRGMAALFVLARHTTDFWGVQFPVSYLAVDIFFILSGFVIAHAYDESLRSKRMGLREFLIVRFIRLYPIFFLSVVLCLAVAVLQMLLRHQTDTDEVWRTTASSLLTALFVPSTLLGNESLYPLNGVYWSLLFELVMNVLYAALHPWLTKRRLAILILTSGVALCVLAYRSHGLDIGFLWSAEHVVGGFVRAAFGISMGLLMYRCRARLASFKLPWVGVLVLAAVLAWPAAWGPGWIFDAVAVLFIFPLAVLAAATTQRSRVQRLLHVLGLASYPIYVLHTPFSTVAGPIFRALHLPQPLAGFVFAVGLIVFGVVLERIYDMPVRKGLSSLLVKSRAHGVSGMKAYGVKT